VVVFAGMCEYVCEMEKAGRLWGKEWWVGGVGRAAVGIMRGGGVSMWGRVHMHPDVVFLSI
jgi:hypothetical protein